MCASGWDGEICKVGHAAGKIGPASAGAQCFSIQFEVTAVVSDAEFAVLWPGVEAAASGSPLEHDEENRKVAVMQTGGPSCPLHLGTLDSPDYWTDDALMAAVRPLSATELHRMALGMQHRKKRRDQFDPAQC